MRRLPSFALLGVGVAFVLSGAAALVHQVVWQRVLVFHTGVGVTSVAIIVAAFLGGLGAGAHAGGLLSRGTGPRAALVRFGLLEIAIGLYAALSPWLFYDVLYRRAGWMYSSLGAGALLHVAALLVPTVCMGMSLPFLVRAVVTAAATPARTIGVLYGINALGAALGALATPWVLVPLAGLTGALWAGAAANVLAGLGALAVAARRSTFAGAEATEAETVPAEGETAVERVLPFPAWMAMSALSGFCAIALEIVWFRLIEVGAKSSAFTFGTVLAIYLGGLGAGGLCGGALAPRMRRPFRVFLGLQVALLAWAGAGLVALASLPTSAPVYSWFHHYWGGAIGASPVRTAWPDLARLYVGFPVVLFGLPTFLMGVSFAALQRAVHDDVADSSRKVGLLQAANIAGCVAGSLAVGLLTLEWLGTTGTVRLILVIGAVLATLGLRQDRRFGAAAAFLLALAVLVPGQEKLWSRLHGLEQTTPFVAEDATGVAAFVPLGEGSYRLYNNGWSHSAVPFGPHTVFGAVPVAAVRHPRHVAIIGLGSGDTAWAAGIRPETERITVFEIKGSEEPLLRSLDAARDFPQLRRFLTDPRVTVRLEDGRRALEHEETLYDVIESDPQYPTVAGSGLLFSREFYELAARRLAPGGVMCAWAPTGRVTDTFRAVFPHTMVLDEDALLLGSNEPLEPPAVWRDRLLAPGVREYLGDTRARKLAASVARAQPLGRGRHRHARLMAPNLDMRPRDEFWLPWISR